MAAYAALVSLINLTEDIKNHPRLSACLDKKQIASLGENVGFLLEFIESYDCHGGNKEAAENLEIEIASAAHAAEDVMESHIVDQIHQDAISNEKSLICLLDLQKVIHEMDYVKEKVIKIEEERGFKYKRPKYSTPDAKSSSTPPSSTRRNSMVGFEEELMQLMDVLTGQQSGRQIISIIGMGGIGKTTLAKHVYEDDVIMRHFDLCAWATITQEFNVQEILSELHNKRESASETVYELGERLHKKLSGRRYLIILDDMWSCEVWDRIKFFFPDNGNRSRIVITTRLSNIAIYCSSSSIVMKFLDEHKSWKLFCEKSFMGEEGCPQELEEIGKRIVKRCRGLPLAIVVIGRHLGKSSGMMKEYWESVANDISAILDSRDQEEQCLEILSLSYYHLPTHLKPCFLYMGIFKEDNEIFVPSLIDLWVAEGILKPNKTQSLDEIAKDYINDLADRNLILVTRWNRGGRIRFLKMHDILRELCIKVAKKEKFFCMLDGPLSIHRDRRVVIHEKITEKKHGAEVFHALQAPPPPVVRSLKCEGGSALSFDFRLLKVMNHVEVEPNEGSFEACFQQVNLRYVDCRLVRSMHDSDINPSPSRPLMNLHLPPSIILLWNLQTLSVGGAYDQIIAPPEIWKMSQLRHVNVSRIYLPDPPESDGSDNLVLEKLKTLRGVENLRLSDEVCKKIPNIKNLRVRYKTASSGYCPHNLGRFRKLETLHCFFSGQSWKDFASCITFPSSLRQLALLNAPLRSEDLTTIGWLPHLTELGLINSAYGPNWDPVERGFSSLKHLEIDGWRDLTCWNAERSHFPVLERLHLGRALKLDEIPLDIGEIATLECIKLQGCSVSASMSAVRILVEQEELGNDGLRVQVHFQEEKQVESFREMVEEEGFTCNNLRVDLISRA